MTELELRLQNLRDLMRSHKIDILLVRSTDQYFNEYVPEESSRRAYVTGFKGSMGDALITQDTATLFVDGRYILQAKMEAPLFDVKLVPLGKSIESAWLSALSHEKSSRFGYDPDTMSVGLLKKIEALGESIKPTAFHLDPLGTSKESKISTVAIDIAGQTTRQKLAGLQRHFDEHNLDAILIVPLDEIAYITNLRGDDFHYQTTFAARAVILRDKILVGANLSSSGLNRGSLRYPQTDLPVNPEDGPEGIIEFVQIKDLFETVKKAVNRTQMRIGLDPDATPQTLFDAMVKIEATPVFLSSPVQRMKAYKNKAELSHMRHAFARADTVVNQVQTWLCSEVCSGAKVTEADVQNFVTEEFFRSGATALSFAPICGAGKNGAIIHHTSPDAKKPIELGSMFLLDTGAYYEGGYATDLTRTFLVGDDSTKATDRQKLMFTSVLRGAIAGMRARFPRGTTGVQLDAITRAPLWEVGFNYEHGTGHGVGINVHEFPPRVSPAGHVSLEVGHVFSIEPGVYLPDFGGVRIENLCTIVDDPNVRDYYCVLPLTFAPIDHRLVDEKMLNNDEIDFLSYFAQGYKLSGNEFPELPPRRF